MSETLKAWERIKEGIDTNVWHCGYWDDIELIEKELKEYEGAKNHIEALHKERVENSLKLKVLEIIKKYIYVNKPFGSACYICLNDESEMIPEEEYDLLKEVLL